MPLPLSAALLPPSPYKKRSKARHTPFSPSAPHLLTLFLTHIKEGDFGEGKVADLKETKRCIGSGAADGVRLMGQRNIP